MKLPRLAGVAALLVSFLFWSGCGDTFRPVANPILSPGPNPVLRTFALVLNRNLNSAGTAAEIDVSGDTSFWNQPVGRVPVHAGILGLQAFVANQAGDSVTTFQLGVVQPSATTLGLLAGSNPTFVLPVTTSSATGGIISAVPNPQQPGTGYGVGDQLTVVQSGASGGVVQVTSVGTSGQVTSVAVISQGSGYQVANALATTGGKGSGAQMDITAVGGVGKVYVANFGNNTVSAIDPVQLPPAVVATVPLTGTAPVAMTATKEGAKIYVVNRATGNISVIDNSTNAVIDTIAAGSTPVAAVTNTVSGLIYVLDATSGTVSVIDPATDTVTATAVPATAITAGPCLATPPGSTAPGSACTPMAFDARSQRLYVADGSGTVSILDASVNPPALLNKIPGLLGPTMVAPLPDGSRAYVVNTAATATSPCGAPSGTGQVSVISASNNQVTKCIPVGDQPVAIAASSDSSRVFVAHQGNGLTLNGSVSSVGVTEIITATDTALAELAAPAGTTPTFVVTSQ
jgi:YVTN family beta-propeller protein